MNNKLTKDNWIKAFEMEMVKICDWFYTDKTVRKSILKATQSQIDLAIEKTNKRWRLKISKWWDDNCECKTPGCKSCPAKKHKWLSDLLEEKNNEL